MTFSCPPVPEPQDPTGVFVILGACLFMLALVAVLELSSRLARYIGKRQARRKAEATD